MDRNKLADRCRLKSFISPSMLEQNNSYLMYKENSFGLNKSFRELQQSNNRRKISHLQIAAETPYQNESRNHSLHINSTGDLNE